MSRPFLRFLWLPHSLWAVAAVFLSLFPVVSAPLSAQAPRAFPNPAEVSIRGGLALYSTGDDTNCPRGPSAFGGVQIRTPGKWFVGASGDLHVGFPFACTLVGTSISYGENHFADEHGGVHFGVAPQMGLRMGHTARMHGVELAPTVEAGALYATHLFSSTDGVWMPWAGGSLGVHLPGSRLWIDANYSLYRIPLRHEIYQHNFSDYSVVYLETRHFGRWKPMVQLALRAAL